MVSVRCCARVLGFPCNRRSGSAARPTTSRCSAHLSSTWASRCARAVLCKGLLGFLHRRGVAARHVLGRASAESARLLCWHQGARGMRPRSAVQLVCDWLAVLLGCRAFERLACWRASRFLCRAAEIALHGANSVWLHGLFAALLPHTTDGSGRQLTATSGLSHLGLSCKGHCMFYAMPGE